eukprot:Rmarinus@m.19101
MMIEKLKNIFRFCDSSFLGIITFAGLNLSFVVACLIVTSFQMDEGEPYEIDEELAFEQDSITDFGDGHEAGWPKDNTNYRLLILLSQLFCDILIFVYASFPMAGRYDVVGAAYCFLYILCTTSFFMDYTEVHDKHSDCSGHDWCRQWKFYVVVLLNGVSTLMTLFTGTSSFIYFLKQTGGTGKVGQQLYVIPNRTGALHAESDNNQMSKLAAAAGKLFLTFPNEQVVECDLCATVVNLSDMKDHVTNDCPRAQTTCPHCGLEMFRAALPLHEERFCMLRPVECRWCTRSIPLCEMKQHHAVSCEKRMTRCAYCFKPMLAKHIDEHERHCDLSDVTMMESAYERDKQKGMLVSSHHAVRDDAKSPHSPSMSLLFSPHAGKDANKNDGWAKAVIPAKLFGSMRMVSVAYATLGPGIPLQGADDFPDTAIVNGQTFSDGTAVCTYCGTTVSSKKLVKHVIFTCDTVKCIPTQVSWARGLTAERISSMVGRKFSSVSIVVSCKGFVILTLRVSSPDQQFVEKNVCRIPLPFSDHVRVEMYGETPSGGAVKVASVRPSVVSWMVASGSRGASVRVSLPVVLSVPPVNKDEGDVEKDKSLIIGTPKGSGPASTPPTPTQGSLSDGGSGVIPPGTIGQIHVVTGASVDIDAAVIPTDPVLRENVVESMLSEFTNKTVSSSPITAREKCDICGDIVLLKIMESHKEVCRLRSWVCPHCHSMFRRDEETTHIRQCPAIRVKCHMCKQQLAMSDLSHHVSSECPERIQQCQFCMSPLPHNFLMNSHEKNCSQRNALSECYVCGMTLPRGKLNSHHKSHEAEGVLPDDDAVSVDSALLLD